MVLRRFAFRLALFLLPWLIILAVPQFRTQLGATITGHHLSYRATPWVGFFSRQDGSRWAIDQNPETLGQQALRVTTGGPISTLPHERERWKLVTFGRLSDQHPREAWLIALALRHISSVRDGRVEYMKARPIQYGYPNAAQQENIYTPEMVKEALRLVRRGQQLEPDNAFFDWMKIRFLLVARRDREALEVLKKAANKPQYNEHISAVMTATLANYESVRPLLPDERTRTMGGVMLPELSLYRHMRGTILWRISQLEAAGRHEEAIAIGTALRRFSTLQMRAVPFLMSSLHATGGVYGVWTAGDRSHSAVPKAQTKLLKNDRKKRADFYSHRYFRYLSQHGHRELLPEARSQLLTYNYVQAGWEGPRVDSFLDPNRNPSLAFSRLCWIGGGLAFAGVVFSLVPWLLLQPIGFRSRLRDITPCHGLPARCAFYPQLIAWSGAALCTVYAGYLQFFKDREMNCTPDWLDVRGAPMLLTYTALALPFLGALLSLSEVRRESKSNWVPSLPELGLPADVVTVLNRTWRIFIWSLFLLIVACTPVTASRLTQQMDDWNAWASWDLLDLRLFLPPVEIVQYVAPVLASLWLLMGLCRAFAKSPWSQGANWVKSFGELRRYCGAYSIVFSWLLLLAFLCNLPPERAINRDFTNYLNLEDRLSQAVTVHSPPAPDVTLKTLPPIPVFPTPTPLPAGMAGGPPMP